MKVLSINAGSSSLKYTLFEMPQEEVLVSGVFERIGLNNSFYSVKIHGEKFEIKASLANHKEAFEILMKELVNRKIVEVLSEIKGVGHRVAQGGAYFSKTVIIDKDVISKIDELSQIAPLHNPPAITAIDAAKEVIKGAIHTAVFDTSFHQTIEEENYLYALPYTWNEEYKVRKYGFHGTSHKYVSNIASNLLENPNSKLITCHIGNGASISAIKNGKCINTSMGLTPNAGLIMGTRCGDIDATIIPYMMDKLNCDSKEIDSILNKQSGLLGISGISSDSRDIEDGIHNGNERCVLAQKMYVRRIIEYIAKYYVELEGCDALIFTAGVGENSISTRREIMEGLKVLGIKIDEKANNNRGKQIKISAEDSSIPVFVIPTNEEVMIARDTFNLI